MHGSGSGLQISLDPDPVLVQILEQKKIAERSLKVIYQKKNLKFMTKDRQKMKKATISY